MKKDNLKQVKAVPKGAAQPAKKEQTATLGKFISKAFVMLLIVVGCVAFTDWKGYFNPDYANDHTRRKWKAYYKFTKSNPIDIVLVGNSHLYTGINPENLSNALGANCFILASPGTTMTDVYYSLKEAISVSKPRVAVIETFGIDDYSSHEMEAGALSDQFKSFSARKNVGQKLASTPVIFHSRNYLAAWSNTVRNHNFIFSDQEQLKRNKELMKHPQPEPTGLYLGRYIRFTSGLEPENLKKYEQGTIGFNSNNFTISDEAKKYVDKTIQLCKAHNIIPVFLTLPMYHKHFNDMERYTAKLAEVIAPYKPLWENQQTPYDYKAFTPDCFENTVSGNQHMTYYGSLISTYKLAHFMNAKLPGTLYDRSKDVSWKQLFYGSDGYFQNYHPENDGVSQLLAQNKQAAGLLVKEIALVPVMGSKQLFLKADKKEFPFDAEKIKLRVVLDIDFKGVKQTMPIELSYSRAYDAIHHFLFASVPLSPEVKGGAVRAVEVVQ